VIRDVAAAIGLAKLNACPHDHLFGSEQILHPPVPSKGDDVRMLDEEKLIGDLAPLASIHELALHCERFRIFDASAMAHFTSTH
jgi:hypothetical protein